MSNNREKIINKKILENSVISRRGIDRKLINKEGV